MGIGNVTERRMQPPQVGVSVVILTLAPAPSGSRLWLPLVRRTRQPFLGRWALPGGGLRADRSLEESAYYALVSTTDLHPRYLEQLYTFGDPARSQGGLPMVSIAVLGHWWAGRKRTISVRPRTCGGSRWTRFPNLPSTIAASSNTPCSDYAPASTQPDVVTTLVGETFTLKPAAWRL